jgi:hypothetical protein
LKTYHLATLNSAVEENIDPWIFKGFEGKLKNGCYLDYLDGSESLKIIFLTFQKK